MRRVLLPLLAAGLVAVSAGHAGGKGGLAIDPATVPRGSTFTLSGCGYPTPTSISFHVEGPVVDYFTAGEPLTAANGCFSQAWTAWWAEPGDYSITSYYRDAKGSTRKVAVVTFAVL